MRRFRLILSSFALIACSSSGDKTTDPIGDPIAAAAGTYALVTVNNAAPPQIVSANSVGHLDILSGTMVLRSDKSYTETIDLRSVFVSGVPSKNDVNIENGTFAITGSTITFSVPATGGNAAFSYSGAVSTGVVTYISEGVAIRYEKH